MKTLCAWCGRILAVPIRAVVRTPSLATNGWVIIWNETKWPDEAEYAARINAPENVSHGICAECERSHFGNRGEVGLVKNNLPQRLMLHMMRDPGRSGFFLTIADADHYPPKGSIEILGRDIIPLVVEVRDGTSLRSEEASPQT